MTTSRLFTRRSHRQLIPADGNCFYNSVITALSEHPLFAPSELTRRVATSLGLSMPTLTVDALKEAIVQSPLWTERVLGMYRVWTDMDRTTQRELLDQYTDQFPAFVQCMSPPTSTTRRRSPHRAGGIRRPPVHNAHRDDRRRNNHAPPPWGATRGKHTVVHWPSAGATCSTWRCPCW